MSQLYFPASPLGWSWINQSGADAPDFLHRLTTVNVRALEVGFGARGCFLNPQGKIRAFFNLWRYGETDFAFETDAGADGNWKTQLLSTIEHFTFAEKFEVAEISAME